MIAYAFLTFILVKVGFFSTRALFILGFCTLGAPRLTHVFPVATVAFAFARTAVHGGRRVPGKVFIGGKQLGPQGNKTLPTASLQSAVQLFGRGAAPQLDLNLLQSMRNRRASRCWARTQHFGHHALRCTIGSQVPLFAVNESANKRVHEYAVNHAMQQIVLGGLPIRGAELRDNGACVKA